MRKINYLALGLLLSTSGCMSLDEVGRHMPVVGKRCENWECFSSDGQEVSEERKTQLRAAGQLQDEDGGHVQRRAVGSQSASSVPFADEQQAKPADKKDLTPFDMSPEQLKSLPLDAAGSE